MNSDIKADRWSLRWGELPPRRSLAAEPCFAELADNPIYRLLIARRRTWRALEHAWLVLPWPGVLVLAVFRKDSAHTIAYFACLWIALTILRVIMRQNFQVTQFVRRKVFFSVPREIMIDLGLAAFPPRDMVAAIWAADQDARTVGARRLSALFALATLWVGLLWPGLNEAVAPSKYIFAAELCFYAFHAGLSASAPYASLPAKATVVDLTWNAIQSRFFTLTVLWESFIVGLSTLLYIGIGAVLIFSVLEVMTSFHLLPSEFTFLEIVFSSRGYLGLAATGAAGLAGLIFGAVARRRAKTDINQMSGQVAFILNWLNREKPHPGGEEEDDVPLHRRIAADAMSNADRPYNTQPDGP